MNSKERFSSRVDTYRKYRPSYPSEAIDYLYGVIGLNESSEVLDIGAGTGIFSRLLLERGTSVTAVEPNEAMREAAVAASKGIPISVRYRGPRRKRGCRINRTIISFARRLSTGSIRRRRRWSSEGCSNPEEKRFWRGIRD